MLPARVENAKWRTDARSVFPAILLRFSSRTTSHPVSGRRTVVRTGQTILHERRPRNTTGVARSLVLKPLES